MKRILATLATAALLDTTASAVELQRKASLGVRMAPAPPGTTGVRIAGVLGGTARTIGLRADDIVTSAGGKPLASAGELAAYAGALRTGDRVEIDALRGGKPIHLRGKAQPKPLETYGDAIVDYGAVPFRGGLLRDILVSPKGVANPPVVYLIQGFSCASIESAEPNDAYRRLGEELVKRGVAYYRVEKPGLGDSAGTPQCVDIDFDTELEAFRDAYKHLIKARGFDPDRIFMFGHSLGGMEAPLLAAETPPRGVAVYGTVFRNWADYHLDIDRYQTFFASGTDPVDAAAATERDRDLIRRFYFEKESPTEIAAANPAYGEAMRELLGWDGGDHAFGRNYKYMQAFSALPLAAAWRSTRSNVLAAYGESDIVAIDDRDHKMIAEVADFYRPGTGRFVQIAGTTHGMELVGNRREYREKAMKLGRPPNGPFNPEIAAVLADWIQQSMTKPPVRLQPDRPAASQDG
jgi:pimeloyl-ACP methyl ester carboxylesterase